MESRKDYPKAQAVWYFILAFGLAYALQFAAMYFYPSYFYQLSLMVVMFMPMLSVLILHKGLGKAKTGIDWKPKKGAMKWFAAAWLGPVLLTALGGTLYYLIFPSQFDATMSRYMMASIPEGTDLQGLTYPMLGIISIISAVTYTPLVNTIPALGEEVGWRGYMVPMLTAKLGKNLALILGGILWGVWHWPIIIGVGYNYGTGYPGAPFTGIAMMCLFTTVIGILLSWLYEKSGSIWAPALGHGAINACASLPILLSDGARTQYLLGPAASGLITLVPFILAAVVVFFTQFKADSQQ